MAKARGLYANIHAKRRRIAAGSGEKMRRPGQKGRPTAKQFARAAKTAKKKKKRKKNIKAKQADLLKRVEIISKQKREVI